MIGVLITCAVILSPSGSESLLKTLVEPAVVIVVVPASAKVIESTEVIGASFTLLIFTLNPSAVVAQPALSFAVTVTTKLPF